MNPVESIQNKTNQMTEEFMTKIKKEIALWLFTKTDGLVSVILYIIFFLSSLILFLLISILMLIFKGITDFNGEITYGAALLSFVSITLASVLISLIIKLFIGRKYRSYQAELIEELGGKVDEVV